MKKLLLGGVALVAMTGFAEAAVVYSADIGNGLTVTLSDTLPVTTFAPQQGDAVAFDDVAFGVSGTVSGVYRSPFFDDTTLYDAVLGDGSLTLGNGYGAGSDTFSFVWGTPDSYNAISFLTDSGLKSFGGAVLGAFADGSGAYLATVSGLGRYYETTFMSGGNSFEFAAVSTVSVVPLPASAPMFGAALVALGALGYGAKRRKAATAA